MKLGNDLCSLLVNGKRKITCYVLLLAVLQHFALCSPYILQYSLVATRETPVHTVVFGGN